jgi:hypothetical protein
VDDDGDGDWWELHKLPEILDIMDREKKEMRERVELSRIERNKSRWALKAQDLEKKDKEKEKEKKKEKEKEKENEKEEEKETSVERKFRLMSERSLGQKQWRAQINALMTGKPEGKFRYDATDSPLSSNMGLLRVMRTRSQKKIIVIIINNLCFYFCLVKFFLEQYLL